MSYWDEFEGEEIINYAEASFAGFDIKPVDREFLLQHGLVRRAAPFLSFESKSSPLKSITEVWKVSGLEAFAMIGSNGSGDPIGISSNGVFVFNHDNNFSCHLINSSVEQMAECLKAYNLLVDITLAQNGDDALLDNNIPESAQINFRESVSKIDSAALKQNAFWAREIATMAEGPWD